MNTAQDPPRSSRLWEIDALRGLMLVLMTVTHVPSRLTDPVGQPFGFVSAAEGFVLLSAFVSGLVYARIGHTAGRPAMRRAFWRRALTVYMCQAATLLFLFTVITALSLRVDNPAVHQLLGYYLAHPHQSFVFALLLVYQPPLLDILPLYILFMLLSPWVMAWGLARGWRGPLLLSALLWALAQFGFTPWLYEQLRGLLHVPVPFSETGSFDTLAWQLLWVVGLALGAGRQAPDAQPYRIAPGLARAALVLAAAVLLWRHLGPGGQAPFGEWQVMNLLFDKWRLGPLRLLDLAAIGVVAVVYGPALARRLPRPRVLETLGRASLPVFCAHLVVVLLVMVAWGGETPARPWWGDVLLMGSVFAALYGVAWGVLRMEARAAARRTARPAAAKPVAVAR
ncbi:OpgC domain-containing protein [Xenophilus arseniciresistens]|uniref:OpgC domain-containing protein n=1 Tax=Xenophilus arseniciresistens TaxID=1283306 RepID=A0AAE3N7G9_9BURK|nr:OpgC domain-containing protein [Xenophilus arseniciresistens]MDA7417435.1 OpgC domain-containing protein [Xenophilus arseniciresistens]